MRTFLLILLTIYGSSFVKAQEDLGSFILLELFTSQGCSSCPPADLLLEEVNKKYADKNVFVMSYHVDYWNRLGWKDPFSKEDFSNYQREYALQFESRSLYTPQLVVNGREHFTGSDRAKMTQSMLKFSNTKPKNKIFLKTYSINSEEINVTYEIIGDTFERITFALVVSKRATSVSRGENRNRTLINSNIVASRVLQSDSNGQVVISVPNWIRENDELSLIAYSQNKNLEVTSVHELPIHK